MYKPKFQAELLKPMPGSVFSG